MASQELSDSHSASTETLSDLEQRTVSDGFGQRKRKDEGGFELRAPSGSASQGDVDSEATVSDVDAWPSGSESCGDHGTPWQPRQRLTKRQLARQQRLLQGIQQTQWNDMQLPKGLDLNTKGKPKKVAVSDEQQLKRMKAAEVRRVRTQKARKDTMEITKARIRAATSNKFRDMVENSQSEKQRVAREERALAKGTIRIRKRIGKSVIVLPEGDEFPESMRPRQMSTYPSKKYAKAAKLMFHMDSVSFERAQRMFRLESGFRMEDVKLGTAIEFVHEKGRRMVYHQGRLLGAVTPMDNPLSHIRFGKLTSIRSFDQGPLSIGVRVENRNAHHFS